jgi:hypothetical protein
MNGLKLHGIGVTWCDLHIYVVIIVYMRLSYFPSSFIVFHVQRCESSGKSRLAARRLESIAPTSQI